MDSSLVGRLVYGLARSTAIAGGVALCVVVAIVFFSVIGRALIPLGLAPIPGDFELVQAGVLFAVFVFLPWCHLERGHAIVAVLTDHFPVRFSVIVEFLWDAVMLLAAVLIAWRLWAGLLDKASNGESTFILRMPLWMVYSAGLIGAVIFVIAAAYCAVRSGRNAISANPVPPLSGAAE